MSNAQPADASSSKAKTQPAASVAVTVVFRDALRKPIEGLFVQLKAGKGTPPAPAWQIGPDPTTVQEAPPASNKADAAPPASAAASASASTATVSPPQAVPSAPASNSGLSPAQASSSGKADPPLLPISDNKTEVTTDKDGFAVTVTNATRNQPIDVFVKNRRGEYAWKAKIVPTKDISAFTIVSPEYHLEATTRLSPKDNFEQDLDLPIVKEGEIMTIERLIHDFGPYIGWAQKVTEQGQVRKDFQKKSKEVTVDPNSHKKKTKTTIEHHYRVIDTGRPNTVTLSVFGSRLSYPSPEFFSDAQQQYMARELNVEIAAIKAIIQQESQGRPYLNNGLPPILYERTLFYDYSVQKIVDAAAVVENAEKKDKNSKGRKKAVTVANPYPAYPDLCFPTRGPYGAEGLGQYEKLARACALDFEIALRATSWGGFQILGDNFKACGYATVFDFVNEFMSGTNGQVKIFIAFMQKVKPQALAGLREHDWVKVARGYNGKYWEKVNPDYPKNLEKFYDSFK